MPSKYVLVLNCLNPGSTYRTGLPFKHRFGCQMDSHHDNCSYQIDWAILIIYDRQTSGAMPSDETRLPTTRP